VQALIKFYFAEIWLCSRLFEKVITTLDFKRERVMAGKVMGKESFKTIRWPQEDWAWLDQIARSVGMTRSKFVREAALAAAEATANGHTPYFVEGPKATRQNTRTNLFEKKSPSGEERTTGAAGVASAKGATTKGAISRSPKG
jgi:hypothetical protein